MSKEIKQLIQQLEKSQKAATTLNSQFSTVMQLMPSLQDQPVSEYSMHLQAYIEANKKLLLLLDLGYAPTANDIAKKTIANKSIINN